MIQLTRLNNHPLTVNSDLIKFVEQAPDTVMTLVNGEKIVVRESAQDVLERVVQFRRSCSRESCSGGTTAPPFACWSDRQAASRTRNSPAREIGAAWIRQPSPGWCSLMGGILARLACWRAATSGQILQPTAAMIVFRRHAGRDPDSISSARRDQQRSSDWHTSSSSPHKMRDSTIELLGQYANKARREGIISLDKEIDTIQEPFLRRALMLAVDGTEPQELRKIMELELDNKEEQEEKIPQIFESAGGFSPTIGIIGAVLGLIQVMQHLDKIDEVGRGIAVAFVATIYGVGARQSLFPARRRKTASIRIREEQIIREMTLEGVISILEGMNPRMLETTLLGLPDAGARSGIGAGGRATHEPPPQTPRSRQSRALAGFLRRFHHSAVCFFRRALCLVPGRQAQGRQTGDGDPGRFSGDGRF